MISAPVVRSNAFSMSVPLSHGLVDLVPAKIRAAALLAVQQGVVDGVVLLPVEVGGHVAKVVVLAPGLSADLDLAVPGQVEGPVGAGLNSHHSSSVVSYLLT